jgi:hypothetical protein
MTESKYVNRKTMEPHHIGVENKKQMRGQSHCYSKPESQNNRSYYGEGGGGILQRKHEHRGT